MRIKDRPHDVEQFREIEPFCVAASDLISPLPPSLFYGSGWHTYHPPKNAITEDRHYWYVTSSNHVVSKRLHASVAYTRCSTQYLPEVLMI